MSSMRVSSPFAYFSSITSMENCCGRTVIFKSSSAISGPHILIASGLLHCIAVAGTLPARRATPNFYTFRSSPAGGATWSRALPTANGRHRAQSLILQSIPHQTQTQSTGKHYDCRTQISSHPSRPRRVDRLPPRLARVLVEHLRFHHLLRDLDDVRDSRHSAEDPTGSLRYRIRPDRRYPGSVGLARPCPARHLHRPLRRTYRLFPDDARHGHTNLDAHLCNAILAIHCVGAACGPRRRQLFGRHPVCRALVPEGPPGPRNGHLRRRQFWCCIDQVRRTRVDRDSGHVDDRAESLCHRNARYGHSLLDDVGNESCSSHCQSAELRQPAERDERPSRMALFAVLLRGVWRLCRPGVVATALLRQSLRIPY